MPEELKNIIDTRELQSLMDDLYALTDIALAILDLKGNVLVAVGWQDICTRFHRIHPETAQNCFESDTHLTAQHLKPGEYVAYKCQNNMWDVVTPIFIGDKHTGNLFIGQFFYDDEVPNMDVFERQADRYGFDKNEYLAALGRVPRFSREKIKAEMTFCTKLASIISRLSDSKLRLEKLHNVIVDITSTLDLDEILQKVTRSATDLIGADGGSISLYDEVKEMMTYPYTYNLPEELLKIMIEKGRGVAEYVMRTNTSIIIDNYPEHPRALKEFSDAGVKTVIGVPLAVKEKRFGMLGVFGMTPEKRFSKEQMDLLEGIGRQAAIAIENAKLFEEIKRFSTTLEQKVAERTSELHDSQTALMNLVDDLNQKQREIEAVNAKLLLEIAERQRTEELLRIRNNELKAFTYTVSHDLKAPLRGIAGYAQELGARHRAGLSERAQFCITQILTATGNLDNLIEDLLHYSRLEVATPALADVNLSQLLQTILKNRDSIITEHGVQISIEIPFTSLSCWEQGLTQALANVIDNALKYSRNAQPPRIDIRGEESAGAFRIIVSDNGIGFNMKYHDRIFGLFNRLVRQEDYEGTGAGLAIAKKALDKQGGSIRAESHPGAGATFFIELPKGKGSE